jgi:hypothetical protein
MNIFILYKKTTTALDTMRLYFIHVWFHFDLPYSIMYYNDYRVLSHFLNALWSMLDTKLKCSTTFHPKSDDQTEVVNRALFHFLFFRMYNHAHLRTWE